MTAREIIQSPLITEKVTNLRNFSNVYAFAVHAKANKIMIKAAVEELFKVNVLDVRVLNYLGKFKRVGRSLGKRPDWKKAIVKLKKDQVISAFEGMN